MRDLSTPLAPTFGGGKKLLKKSGKKYYKSMVAVDEGRFKKEQKLRKKVGDKVIESGRSFCFRAIK